MPKTQSSEFISLVASYSLIIVAFKGLLIEVSFDAPHQKVKKTSNLYCHIRFNECWIRVLSCVLDFALGRPDRKYLFSARTFHFKEFMS